MKKVLAVLLAMGMTAALLTACGGSGSEEKESKKIESADDLEGAKIGVQTGTTGDIYVTDDYGDENVERFNKGFEAVQSLSQGKIDAVVIDDQPAQACIEEVEGLKILEAPYVEEDYAMCFKKDNAVVADFNKAIQELKDDGTFDQIVTYYIEGKGDRYVSPEASTDPRASWSWLPTPSSRLMSSERIRRSSVSTLISLRLSATSSAMSLRSRTWPLTRSSRPYRAARLTSAQRA